MKRKHTNAGGEDRGILFAQGLQHIEQFVRDRSGGKSSALPAGRLKAARVGRSAASRRISFGLGAFLLAGLVASAQAAESGLPKTIEGTRMVTSVAFSPDGRRMASGGWDNKVQLWAVPAFAKVGEIGLSGSGDLLLDLAFSPKGRRIVTGSRQDSKTGNPTVKVWDARTGAEVLFLKNAPSEFCDSVSYSPDGKLIAAGCFNQTSAARTIHLWDARTGDETPTIENVNGPVAFSSDSKWVSGGDGYNLALKLFEIDNAGKAPIIIDGKNFKGFSSAAFSPVDNNLIVTGNGDGTIKLWNASTGQPSKVTFSGKHGDRVSAVAFSPDGKYLVSISVNKTTSVKLWKVENGEELKTLEGQPGDSSAVAFSAGWIASGGQEGVKLWAVENGTIKP